MRNVQNSSGSGRISAAGDGQSSPASDVSDLKTPAARRLKQSVRGPGTQSRKKRKSAPADPIHGEVGRDADLSLLMFTEIHVVPYVGTCSIVTRDKQIGEIGQAVDAGTEEQRDNPTPGIVRGAYPTPVAASGTVMTCWAVGHSERCKDAEGEAKSANPQSRAAGTDAMPTTINWGRGPRWDEKNRQFLFDGKVIHTYKHKAENQFAVLRAFQAAGWERTIKSPLRKDLHSQTLKALNAFAPDEIKFHGDGTGEGLRWEKPGAKQPEGPGA
jgi:hypothetical protein